MCNYYKNVNYNFNQIIKAGIVNSDVSLYSSFNGKVEFIKSINLSDK